MELETYLLVAAVGLGVMTVVSAAGNLFMIYRLVRRMKAGKANRLDTLLIHMAIADLMVTFLVIFLRMLMVLDVPWLAGDIMCRLTTFMSAMGLYLSSFVVICIAVDRYYTIVKPLNVSWESRLRRVLYSVWGSAALAGMPELFLTHVVESQGTTRCEALDPIKYHLAAYDFYDMALLYILPLAATVYCSSAAIHQIIKRMKAGHDGLRRSGAGVLGRARVRTLQMTITIVAVHLVCWTPYYSFIVWYYIDREALLSQGPMIQSTWALVSCTNCCANPIVYGIFTRKRKNRVAPKLATVAVIALPRERVPRTTSSAAVEQTHL